MMLMRDVARRLPDWEAPAKLSLALALLLFIVMLALGIRGPQIGTASGADRRFWTANNGAAHRPLGQSARDLALS